MYDGVHIPGRTVPVMFILRGYFLVRDAVDDFLGDEFHSLHLHLYVGRYVWDKRAYDPLNSKNKPLEANKYPESKLK